MPSTTKCKHCQSSSNNEFLKKLLNLPKLQIDDPKKEDYKITTVNLAKKKPKIGSQKRTTLF